MHTHSLRRLIGTALTFTLLLGALAPSLHAAGANKGGVGGGGSVKTVEARVTGYITAIDHSAGTLTVGASYYGSGKLVVTPSTKISLDAVNCTFDQLTLGTWVEARYNFATKAATKLSASR